MLNQVELIGNVGKDPDIKSIQNGSKVANLSIATSEKWKDRNSGEQREHTEWHRVVVWGNKNGDGLAGIVEKYVSKGDKIYVRGQLKTRKWQDNNGNDRYSTEVVLSGFDAKLLLLGSSGGGGRSSSSEGNSGGSSGGGGGRSEADNSSRGGGDLDDEIPFAPLRDLP